MHLVRRGTALATAGLLASYAFAAVPFASAAPTCFGKRATVVGSRGDDQIGGTRRADVIVGLGGSDLIEGLGGNDLICGGGGFDVLLGGAGKDRLNGQKGPDLLEGGGGNDLVKAGGGPFHVLAGGPGDDRLKGGGGFDIVSYARSRNPVVVDLAQGRATGEGNDTLARIEGAAGSSFDDTLTGDAGPNLLAGLDGNDALASGGNSGSLDSPQATVAADLLEGGGGDDALTGGAGLNIVFYYGAPRGVDVNLTTGKATGEGNDTLTGIQAVVGSEFDDTLVGDAEANALEGYAGTNTIDGRAGEDVLVFLDADGATADLAAGTATSNEIVFTDQGTRQVAGQHSLTAMENIWGSLGDDVLSGDAGPNELYGLDGRDQLAGAAGDDLLDGGAGDDTLNGGDGNDTCANGETNSGCETTSSAARAQLASTGWMPTRLPLDIAGRSILLLTLRD